MNPTPAARRPKMRCQTMRPGDPPAGTIETDPQGEVVVHVGTTWQPEQHDVEALAEQLLDGPAVTFSGSLYAARQARTAVYRVWTAEARTAREAARPPRAPAAPKPPPRGRCGRPRTDGGICRQYSGWGADDPQGPCRAHGGSTVQREQQREELVAKVMRWVTLSKKARTAELTPAENLEHLVAMRDILVARQQGRLR